MTCIVALKADGKVVMGADSAGVGGLSLAVRKDQKIHRVGGMLIGFTSSFRMGQLLGYKLKVPDHDPRHSLEKYMVTDFVDAVRQCLKDGGYARRKEEEEIGGCFIVAYKGEIFTIESDYQVGIQRTDYYSVGCGSDIALGALFATEGNADVFNQRRRVSIALEAAERFSSGVRGPFIVEELAAV